MLVGTVRLLHNSVLRFTLLIYTRVIKYQNMPAKTKFINRRFASHWWDMTIGWMGRGDLLNKNLKFMVNRTVKRT